MTYLDRFPELFRVTFRAKRDRYSRDVDQRVALLLKIAGRELGLRCTGIEAARTTARSNAMPRDDAAAPQGNHGPQGQHGKGDHYSSAPEAWTTGCHASRAGSEDEGGSSQ